MKTRLRIIALIVAIMTLSWSTTASATGLLQCTPFKSGLDTTFLSPLKMKVLATIQDQIATTVVREEFRQTSSDSAKTEYGFPIPMNASVSGVRLWIDGQEYTLEMSKAQTDTAKSARGGAVTEILLQTAFARYGYTNLLFTLPITTTVHRGSLVTVEITYIELLPYTLGMSTYAFPLKSLQGDPYMTDTTNTRDFSIAVMLETGMTLDTAWSTSHAGVNFKKEFDNLGVQLGLAGKGLYDSRVKQDFSMQFRVSQTAIKSAFYSSKPVKDDGHFVFLLRPDANISTTAVLPKIFTFIIDVSGSMNGTKIRQAQEAAQYCISNLNPQDGFNVVAFNNTVRSFSATPVQATGNNIASANRFIANLIAGGGTDLQGAAIAGLAQYDDSKTVNVIIFLTDGVAPMDHTMINNANRARVRMSVFGVGSDVNSQALARLAADNNGLAEFITETQKTSSVISGFYDRIRFPLWTNLSMSIDGGATYDVLPTLMPDLNVGEQLVVAGRYKKPGAATITVRGTAYGVAVERRVPVVFSGDSLSDVFCPKVWARMRIEFVKSLMAKELPNTSRWLAYRNEIVILGLRYGIVTEFTTYKDTGTISFTELADAASTELASYAYPNPFSGSTTIAYSVRESASVRISIIDINGREVSLLVDAQRTAGEHTVTWDGRDDQGNEVPTGMYLCIIRIGNIEHVVHLTITR